ncbi:Uncharacterized protein FWK35_00020227 [Aphis craccivora]|uniref:Uncharacterized protein n=1 Tax=Aphis craccivora TaxID=307492 RepID=A0A6G0YPG4_APHCR|nr:Uncharacterized protein FWK35_00020227 [Aphis craccivora]
MMWRGVNTYECLLLFKFFHCHKNYIMSSDSYRVKRRDECIDFTMLCVFFFVCLCTQERVEIMLQFQTLGVVSDRKMNLGSALGRSFFEFPNIFQKRREKPKKKIKEKREFLHKTIKFSKNFDFFDVDKKILDDQKIPYKFVYDSNFYEICRKRENLQLRVENSIRDFP